MNSPKPMAERANPIIVSIHALVIAAMLIGCGREGTKNIKTTEPIASESTLPPVSPNQNDASPPTGVEAGNPGLVHNLPQTVTNMPPPLTLRTNPAPGVTKEYVVVKGDTWFKIARASGVKFSALTNANPTVSLSPLKVGQKIRIPAAAAPASAGIALKEPGNAGNGALPSAGNVHVVKAGETLTQIAKQNHTTVKALQAANGLKTTRVLVGQKLRLVAPGQPTA